MTFVWLFAKVFSQGLCGSVRFSFPACGTTQHYSGDCSLISVIAFRQPIVILEVASTRYWLA